MSRSKRKTPIFGISIATSEKKDKRRWNKTFRRIAKSKVFLLEEAPVKLAAVTDIWDGAKDGRRYFLKHTPKDLRK